MSVVLARVDNRLVHGQILSAWVPSLEIDAIVVADDEAAGNTLVRSAMAIAIPPDVQFTVVPVARVAEAVTAQGPRARTLVLVRDVADARRALDAGLVLTSLNLGNVHFASDRSSVTPSVHLSVAEVAELDALEGRGIAIELRTLPRDTPMPLTEVARRVRGHA